MVSVIWLSFICIAFNQVDGSVLDLGAMVATSGACFAAKLWKNYGCFCGLGQCGSGVPVGACICLLFEIMILSVGSPECMSRKHVKRFLALSLNTYHSIITKQIDHHIV